MQNCVYEESFTRKMPHFSCFDPDDNTWQIKFYGNIQLSKNERFYFETSLSCLLVLAKPWKASHFILSDRHWLVNSGRAPQHSSVTAYPELSVSSMPPVQRNPWESLNAWKKGTKGNNFPGRQQFGHSASKKYVASLRGICCTNNSLRIGCSYEQVWWGAQIRSTSWILGATRILVQPTQKNVARFLGLWPSTWTTKNLYLTNGRWPNGP